MVQPNKCIEQCLALGEPHANLAVPFNVLEKALLLLLNSVIYLPMVKTYLSYEV